MKKILACLVFIILVSDFVYAQTDTVYINGVPKIRKRGSSIEELEPSPLKKDDYLFELSYGVPYAPVKEADFFGLDLFTNTVVGKTIKTTNHICARVDYQLNKEYSVGLEFTYASTSFSYIRHYAVRTGTTLTSIDSSFTAKATKVRFLAKMGYHLNISEKFDAYGTAGFGYKEFRYSTKDAYVNTTDFFNKIFPVAIRVSLGGRFFLKENIAIHVEGGIGGPLMQIGLSWKMN